MRVRLCWICQAPYRSVMWRSVTGRTRHSCVDSVQYSDVPWSVDVNCSFADFVDSCAKYCLPAVKDVDRVNIMSTRQLRFLIGWRARAQSGGLLLRLKLPIWRIWFYCRRNPHATSIFSNGNIVVGWLHIFSHGWRATLLQSWWNQQLADSGKLLVDQNITDSESLMYIQ